MNFKFFQQMMPTKIDPKGDKESMHRLQLREIKAQNNGFKSSEEAIKNAKTWDVYKHGKALGRHPIVQELV